MYNCIICKNQTKNLPLPKLKSVVPMGDKLCNFKLQKCVYCGHIQKKIDLNWKKSMRNLYSQKYTFLGKHISLSGKKIVNRNEQSAKLINKTLNLKSHGNFLDIGCGIGQFIEAFSGIKKKWNVYAHDLTDLNKKYVLKNNVKKFFVGDISKIKIKFDLISMNHVVEHLTDPVKALKEVRNLLNDKGNLILRLPNIDKVHTDLTIQDHCSHFDFQTLSNLLKLTGYKIEKSLNNVNPIELFVIVTKSSSVQRIKKRSLNKKKLTNLFWPDKICKKINNDTSKKIGIFGVGTASFYYYAKMKNKVSFFVDEDPLKINKKYYGKTIYDIKNIPLGSNVYIGIHNYNFANKIKKRVSKINKKVNFFVPN